MLCTECSEMEIRACMVGECEECKVLTPYAERLCPACSTKLKQCEDCRVNLA